MSRTLNKQQPAPSKSNSKEPTSWKDRLHPEQYESLRNTFDVFDEDHSGTIDPEEINKILEELGSEKRNPFIVSLIEGLRDKKKPIAFQEFLDSVCPKIGDLKTKEGLKTIFKHFDSNEDGVLDF